MGRSGPQLGYFSYVGSLRGNREEAGQCISLIAHVPITHFLHLGSPKVLPPLSRVHLSWEPARDGHIHTTPPSLSPISLSIPPISGKLLLFCQCPSAHNIDGCGVSAQSASPDQCPQAFGLLCCLFCSPGHHYNTECSEFSAGGGHFSQASNTGNFNDSITHSSPRRNDV